MWEPEKLLCIVCIDSVDVPFINIYVYESAKFTHNYDYLIIFIVNHKSYKYTFKKENRNTEAEKLHCSIYDRTREIPVFCL